MTGGVVLDVIAFDGKAEHLAKIAQQVASDYGRAALDNIVKTISNHAALHVFSRNIAKPRQNVFFETSAHFRAFVFAPIQSSAFPALE